ncbi:hypothetical protein, partial [Stenotrophomonas sp. 3diitr2024]|uniref:hypothetical protein n=1 Tax=Stenotrophomonas sp. 3diitr2024 TaxID=3345115 RepID=UPI0035CABC9E
ALSRRLGAMVRDGQLVQNRRGGFAPIQTLNLVTGVVIANLRGFLAAQGVASVGLLPLGIALFGGTAWLGPLVTAGALPEEPDGRGVAEIGMRYAPRCAEGRCCVEGVC